MSSFRTFNQGPLGINYMGSNHPIYCTVEGSCNTLVLYHAKTGASHEGRAGKGDRFRQTMNFPYFNQQEALIKIQQNKQ
jgi:hypothetical protein